MRAAASQISAVRALNASPVLRLYREEEADEDSGDAVRCDDGEILFYHTVGEPEQDASEEDDEHRKREVGGRPRAPRSHDLRCKRERCKRAGDEAECGDGV